MFIRFREDAIGNTPITVGMFFFSCSHPTIEFISLMFSFEDDKTDHQGRYIRSHILSNNN